jgi:hypothetical protein
MNALERLKRLRDKLRATKGHVAAVILAEACADEIEDILPGLEAMIADAPPVLRKKSVRDEFVGENLRETLDCSHYHTRGMLPAP